MAKIYSVSDNNSNVRDTEDRRKKTSNFGYIKREGENQTLVVDFSPKLMSFIVLLLAFIFFSRQILMILMFLFFGFAIMSSIRPIVNWLKRRGISKGWAIAISYVILFILIQLVLILVFVPFVNQLAGLISEIPRWIDNILSYLENFAVGEYILDIDMVSQYITDIIKSFPTADNVKNVANFLSGFFGVGAFLVTSIVFSIYLVSEHDSFFDILLIRIVSDEKRERVRKLVLEVERKLGGWVLGQGVISTLAAIFSGTVLTILGVPFALPLAIFTGVMGVIPNLGSTLSGVVMALVALITLGPISAAILLGAFILYQPLENTVITPRVMGNAVGLKPIIVLVGVIIFLILFGIVGGFVAVPLMVIIKILYEFYIDLQKLKAKGIV
jgi:predicted PurR-regulated permease PerM